MSYVLHARIPGAGLPPVEVRVERATLYTQRRDVIRLTTIGEDRSARVPLTREQAEHLSDAILEAADLLVDDPQPEPVRPGERPSMGDLPATYQRTADRATGLIREYATEATAAGASIHGMVSAFVSGITGKLHGHDERRIANALSALIADVVEEGEPT